MTQEWVYKKKALCNKREKFIKYLLNIWMLIARVILKWTTITSIFSVSVNNAYKSDLKYITNTKNG